MAVGSGRGPGLATRRVPAREGAGTAPLGVDLVLRPGRPAEPQPPDGQNYASGSEQEHARDGHPFGGGWCVHRLCLGPIKSGLDETLVTATLSSIALPSEW